VGDPEKTLDEIRGQGPVQVWAEGDARPDGEHASRRDLAQGPRLAIWTAPPSPKVLQSSIERVQPEEVIVFAVDPGSDESAVFRQTLAGMVKHALRKLDGQVELERAAAHVSQTKMAVQAGLDWLAASGVIVVLEREEAVWRIAPGDGTTDAEEEMLALVQLDALLAETAAYRDYFLKAPQPALVKLLIQLRGE
jgi:hypothetical protein